MVSRRIFPEASGSPQAGGATSIPFPAPVKGLNTRDGNISLGQDEARELVNWVPDAGSCSVRPGHQAFATVAGSKPVKSLMRYIKGATSGLVAASNGGLFNVASGTPATLNTGYTNDLWSSDYNNGFLFAVNGVDTPWRYDGSTVTATGFSGAGLTLTSLRTVKEVSNRLWFTVVNSGDVYYAQPLAVTGPLTPFALSQIADGGFCMGVFQWRTATVFCMSTGQVLIYQGDPQTDITLANKYYAPPLVEPDAAVRMGGELILLTTSGPISMDVVAAGLAFDLVALGSWSKIAPSWQADVVTYGSNPGWFGKFINGFVYFNVATGAPTTKQYVFNTRNQAWTTFENLPLASMEQLGSGSIYIGSCVGDGNVYLHAGGLDNGNQIVQRARQGFSYMGDPGRIKRISGIKPNIFTTGILSGQFQVDVDFVSSNISAPIVSLSKGGSTTPWDSAWDSSWAQETIARPKFLTTKNKGRAAAPAMITYSSATDAKWSSCDILVTGGSAK